MLVELDDSSWKMKPLLSLLSSLALSMAQVFDVQCLIVSPDFLL